MTNAFGFPCGRMAITPASAVIRLVVVAAACGSLLWTEGSILSAQVTPTAATVTPPKFEVATIKRSAPGASQTGTVFQPGGWYRAFNVRLRDLVSEAYRVRGFQVIGGPSWAALDRFDIEAKSDDPASFTLVPKADGTRTMSGDPFRMLRELFGAADAAVGQRVRLDEDLWREVVGVVGNVRTTFFNTLEWQTAPMVYRPAAQSLAQPPDPEATHLTLWVHIRADRLLSAANVRDAASAVSPRAAVLSVQPVSDMVADATRQPTLRMTLLLGFCGASLLLAGIGVYGIVAQAVTERPREIAIRIALGAQPRALTLSFVREAMAAGASGLAIGIVLSMMLTRLLGSMLYGVRTGDLSSLMAAGVLMLAVTGVAAWVPALRATRVPAFHVLRT